MKNFSVLCGQCDKLFYIVGLDLCKMSRAVTAYCTALFAFMHDYISLFRIDLGCYGLHNTAAPVCSIAGINVNVKRVQTVRTMVSRRVSERLDIEPAVLTDKSAIIFCKNFLFHFYISVCS